MFGRHGICAASEEASVSAAARCVSDRLASWWCAGCTMCACQSCTSALRPSFVRNSHPLVACRPSLRRGKPYACATKDVAHQHGSHARNQPVLLRTKQRPVLNHASSGSHSPIHIVRQSTRSKKVRGYCLRPLGESPVTSGEA
jgi:hypothetical protein